MTRVSSQMQDKLAIWTKSADNVEVVMAIGRKLKSVLEMNPGDKIDFMVRYHFAFFLLRFLSYSFLDTIPANVLYFLRIFFNFKFCLECIDLLLSFSIQPGTRRRILKECQAKTFLINPSV